MEKNILPDSSAAPALQEKQRELEMRMRADSLEKGIQGRPGREVLVREGILRGKFVPTLCQGGQGNLADCGLLVVQKMRVRLWRIRGAWYGWVWRVGVGLLNVGL